VRENVAVPIIADESVETSRDIEALIGAVDGINIKLMKCGGLCEALKMIHVARAVGMKVMLGCMVESSVGITAAAHLSPAVDYADLDGNLLLAQDPFSGVKVLQGKLVLSSEPGLGVKARGTGCDAI
jgi:L-alanine-DL-glutamate epimerase-like enolase superfamily enzyme